MNKLLLSLSLVFFVSMSSLAENKAEKLQSFLENITDLPANLLTGSEPLVQVASLLNEKAAKKISVTKANIGDALAEAGNFKHAILIVGKHTIVKITDLNDRNPSGSWETSMPKGTALVQKSGSFSERTDYINNLIGIPDHQERNLYLLN